MVVELRRYLGDTLRVQVHDADRESPHCGLGQIVAEHRHWYDSLDEALGEASYRGCSWCLGGSDRSVSALDPTATGTATD